MNLKGEVACSPAVVMHWFLPGWAGLWILGATVPLFLPLAPLIFRYSRVIWMHLDWTIDPPGESR